MTNRIQFTPAYSNADGNSDTHTHTHTYTDSNSHAHVNELQFRRLDWQRRRFLLWAGQSGLNNNGRPDHGGSYFYS